MVGRHPSHPRNLPATWLFSDERLAAGMRALATIVPPGSGIVVRHDALPAGLRWRLVRRLMGLARTRKLLVLLAGSPALARRWGAHGVHLRQPMAARAGQAHRLGLVVTMPVHTAREARRARRAAAHGTFISPLHPTRSHAGAPALGRAQWLRLARLAGGKAIALGGMTPARARALQRASGLKPGWAAIDAWDGKAAKRRRKAVPRFGSG